MDSEIAFERSPGYRVYKSGRIERLLGETTVAPSLNPQNGVVSKDIIYSPEKNLSLRIYLPEKISDVTDTKLPILIYFHGGGFIIETAFSPTYHTFLTSTIAATNCLAISVDYRRAPEFPIPIPYEDSWDSLKWVLTHISGTGPENWINKHGDFGKLYLAGDSAGGNIAHHLTIRAKRENLEKSVISGIILIHPYFWGKTPIDELETRDVARTKGVEGSWRIASPNSKEGVDDPWLNVVGSESSDLSGLGCGRVLVMVAGDDMFVRQGWGYAAKLQKSGWEGKVEVMETKDESHVFHLKDPNTDNARQVVKKLAEFINARDKTKYLFYIFKMNLESGKWERVDSIGDDEMLIFGHGVTIRAPVQDVGDGFKSGSICFVKDDLWPGYTCLSYCGVFDLATGRVNWSKKFRFHITKTQWFVPGFA